MVIKEWISNFKSSAYRIGLAVILLLPCALSVCLSEGETDAVDIYEIEIRLGELGYFSRECDDVYDEYTAQAIEDFQTANSLSVSGQIDQATLELIKSNTAITKKEYLEQFAHVYDGIELKYGNINENVKKLQAKLGELGYYNGDADGVFGEATKIAVINFQSAHGLMPTGIADSSMLIRAFYGQPLNWSQYISTRCCDVGSNGDNVNDLQSRLKSMGYFNGECTGNYGENTRQAVMIFQRENGLNENGIADYATCDLLYSYQEEESLLRLGMNSNMVVELQSILSDLGYYSGEATGEYDNGTETAVMLYQKANGIKISGQIEESDITDGMIHSKTLDEAREELQYSTDELTGEQLTKVAELATNMLGQTFGISIDEPWKGITFIKYAFLKAGAAFVDEEKLLNTSAIKVQNREELKSGGIVAVESNGNVVLSGICIGDGAVAYYDKGYIVKGYLEQINMGETVYWYFGDE